MFIVEIIDLIIIIIFTIVFVKIILLGIKALLGHDSPQHTANYMRDADSSMEEDNNKTHSYYEHAEEYHQHYDNSDGDSQFKGGHNKTYNSILFDYNAKRYGEVLGLQGNVTIENIKKAYKQKIKRCHPDKVSHLGPEKQYKAEVETKEINEAYRYFRNKYKF